MWRLTLATSKFLFLYINNFKMADCDNSGNTVESPRILMKVDEVAENSTKNKEEEENEKNNELLGLDASKVCSPSVLASSIKNSNQTDVRESVKPLLKSSAFLRPSQLNGNVGDNSVVSQKSFLLNPSRLNPFTKTPNDDAENIDQKGKPSNSVTTPKFLPLFQNGSKRESVTQTTTSVTPSTSSITTSSSFIFGQNIQDRVVSENTAEDVKSTSCTANTNGTSDMLFSSALKETAPILDGASSSKTLCTKSLSESAKEYEESRAVKRKYEEVEIKTGEEGETNVLQITCKLFAFDKCGGGSWQERGRGILRLNDLEADEVGNSHSRLVFRAAGSLRVVLNTKIWGEMTIQRASNKSIRLTAFDSNGEIKVFLLTGNPEDINQLQRHLETRVRKETENQKKLDASEPDIKKLAAAEGNETVPKNEH